MNCVIIDSGYGLSSVGAKLLPEPVVTKCLLDI